MSETEAVYTRDKSSGRIHLRVRVNGSLMSSEQDNLDSAGEFDIVDDAIVADASPGQLCARCFPQPDFPGDDAPEAA